MGNTVTLSIFFGGIVGCFVVVCVAMRSRARSDLLGLISLGIGLFAGWHAVSGLQRGHEKFFIIVYGSTSLIGLIGAKRQLFAGQNREES